MSQSAFHIARAETCRYLDLHNVTDHMFHGPVSDCYWSEPIKVVAINMEAYGYQGCGHCHVDKETLTSWLYDAGDTDTRTTRYTLTVLAVLLKRLGQGAPADWGAMQKVYADGPVLEEALARTAYFNIRPETNARKEQDFDAIAGVGCSPIGALLWNEILALDPDVLFVSGHAGLKALNGLAGLPEPLGFRAITKHPMGFLIQSISHPSRPNYTAWVEVIETIAERITAERKELCHG